VRETATGAQYAGEPDPYRKPGSEDTDETDDTTE
jgi:ribosome-binding factor A